MCNFDTIEWIIENFQFCWHKTGERLESPLFNINFLGGTSWRLWVYPRGEDNGEYTSFYLFREKGGPEEVEVDLEFSLTIGRLELPKPDLKKCSFKIHQKEGYACFHSRWKIFSPKVVKKLQLPFHFVCKVFNRNEEEFSGSKINFVTSVGMNRIHGTEICDDATDCVSRIPKNIEVKPMLEEQPLININLSFVEDSLVTQILPVNCKKIKYAICELTIIKSWDNESPIKYFYSWIGEIKSNIWRHHLCIPGTESSIPDPNSSTDIAFFVNYDFAFSTGEIVEICGLDECERYVTSSKTSVEQYLNLKTLNSSSTALDGLEEVYRSKSFINVKFNLLTETHDLHLAILYARSPKLIDILFQAKGEFLSGPLDSNYRHFFLFLYTDVVNILSVSMAYDLYTLAEFYDVELLKTKCIHFFIDHINFENACRILHVARETKDLPFITSVENYIVEHYDLILSFMECESIEIKSELRKDILFLKYKNKTL